MKRSGSNRVARKIGSYDDNDSGNDPASAESGHSSQNEAEKPSGFPC